MPRKSVAEIRNEIRRFFNQDPSLSDLLKIEKKDNPDLVFDKLEKFIEDNVRGITSTQLRKLVDVMKDKSSPFSINIARPEFALMIAKSRKDEAKKIMLLVDELAALAAYDEDEKLYEGFPFFIESLIAFHRYHDTIRLRRMKSGDLAREVQKELFKNERTPIASLLDFSKISQNLDAIEHFLDKNSKGITANQLRNIFDDLNSKELPEIKRSKPVLSYTAARQQRTESVKLIFLINDLIKNATNADDLKRLLEAIVSIHKYKETFAYRKNQPDFRNHFGQGANSVLLNMTERFGDFADVQDKLRKFISKNGKGLKSSQFHRLLQPVTIAKMPEDLAWLRPLFLYTAARQSNSKARNILLFLVDLIRSVKTEEDVKGFQLVTEDMVAFHRFYDAVDSKVNLW